MSTRLSRRQQQIVGCKNPYMQHHQMSVWGNRGVYCIKGITVKEVNAARKLARGRFWWEKIVSSYVANPPKERSNCLRSEIQ